MRPSHTEEEKNRQNVAASVRTSLISNFSSMLRYVKKFSLFDAKFLFSITEDLFESKTNSKGGGGLFSYSEDRADTVLKTNGL